MDEISCATGDLSVLHGTLPNCFVAKQGCHCNLLASHDGLMFLPRSFASFTRVDRTTQPSDPFPSKRTGKLNGEVSCHISIPF
jgi:hypothetical protein